MCSTLTRVLKLQNKTTLATNRHQMSTSQSKTLPTAQVPTQQRRNNRKRNKNNSNANSSSSNKKKTALPNLPLELWNIIIGYTVGSLTKQVYSLSFNRDSKGKHKFITGDSETSEYLSSLINLCKVNRAFNASVKRLEEYTRIWNRFKILKRIPRVSEVEHFLCSCDCGCEGQWELVFNAECPTKSSLQKQMNMNHQMAASILGLLVLDEQLHFDEMKVTGGRLHLLMPPLAKKLSNYKERNPDKEVYTDKVIFEDDYSADEDERDDIVDAAQEITEDLTEMAAHSSVEPYENYPVFCDVCGDVQILTNQEPDHEDLCQMCLEHGEGFSVNYSDDGDYFDYYSDEDDYYTDEDDYDDEEDEGDSDGDEEDDSEGDEEDDSEGHSEGDDSEGGNEGNNNERFGFIEGEVQTLTINLNELLLQRRRQ